MTEQISYSTVRLLMRYGMQVLGIGSGFLYGKNDQIFLITAWHNLTGRHVETLKPISEHGGIPDNIVVDFPTHSINAANSLYSRVPIVLPLEKNGHATYMVHNQPWPRVDVAVMKISQQEEYISELYFYDGEKVERKIQLPQQVVGFQSTIPHIKPHPHLDKIKHQAGDDLFLLGYPRGVTDQFVNPIWKRATIAVEYDQGWVGKNRFLVDSATREGLSGGLAIYYNKEGHIPGTGIRIVNVPQCVIHGVYTGRVGDDTFQAQLGIVWKSFVIDEIIDLSLEAICSSDIELSQAEVIKKVKQEYPDHVNCNVYIDKQPGLYSLLHHIMTELQGRANPNFVMEQIINIAGQKKIQSEAS